MTQLLRRISVMYLYFLPIIIGFGVMVSCKPHENNDVLLKFSKPVVTFDTVFTTIGSVTKSFTVHNPSNKEVTTNIFLAGKNSNFSINVDGEPGTYFKNVTIPKKDSIFIFVTVNVNPNQPVSNSPFFINDSIVFLTGTRTQDVKLTAYGQNAKYILADQILGSLHIKIVAKEHETVRWTNEKPYVVYGWAAIDSTATLIIDPGTKVYFHKTAFRPTDSSGWSSGLWAYRCSTLEVKGTKEEPVLFRGDRLEKDFDDDYAQWDRIWINEGANVTIKNAIITNAFVGVQVEALPYGNGMIDPNPISCNSSVKIENTIIKNTKNCGVLSRFLNIEMTNCVIANNGASSLQLEGGQYTMKHLTIANNYNLRPERKTPACYVSNVISAYDDLAYEIKANFMNCIITGKIETEVEINKKGSADLTASFQNCLVKAKNNSDYFIDCLRNEDSKFEDKDKLDFRLKPGSPAIGKGKDIGVKFDILGTTRKNPPDIGAYESQ